MRHFSVRILSSFAALVLAGSANAATLYDATADFSVAANQSNGVWTYGYYNVGGTSFTQFTIANSNADSSWHANPNLIAWSQHLYDSSAYSVVGKNPTGSLQHENANGTGSIAIDAGTLFFHPGNSGEKSTIRFTSPGAGTVDINATFSADDTAGGNRDVHVYKNGVSIFDGNVTGAKGTATPASPSFTALAVNQGDTIDFSVGYGTDNVYFNDATGFAGTVNFTSVPEPSIALVGAGIAGGALLRRRRFAGK